MRGYPEFNFPAFAVVTEGLRAQGYRAFSPAERDMEKGFNPAGMAGSQDELDALGFDLREALLADCEFICKEATHLWMLPGWNKSSGATAERALGLALGLEIEGAPA